MPVYPILLIALQIRNGPQWPRKFLIATHFVGLPSLFNGEKLGKQAAYCTHPHGNWV